MRRVLFDDKSFEDFNEWGKLDKKIHQKIIDLIDATRRDPFRGLGKPEPLKHQFKGLWSRRITDEHRLIYEVLDDQIRIVSCRDHYH